VAMRRACREVASAAFHGAQNLSTHMHTRVAAADVAEAVQRPAEHVTAGGGNRAAASERQGEKERG
jgi:hypothetical protein